MKSLDYLIEKTQGNSFVFAKKTFFILVEKVPRVLSLVGKCPGSPYWFQFGAQGDPVRPSLMGKVPGPRKFNKFAAKFCKLEKN